MYHVVYVFYKLDDDEKKRKAMLKKPIDKEKELNQKKDTAKHLKVI